ncbi:MAG: extracellular solute-binding protein [Betaproteobacteria bacterium]|nr:extracellular solute-binding protein [Betaproteobacteria bacterium]
MNARKFNRRRFLGASPALAVAPYIRTSRAAGSLVVGFWDHWVPGANEALAKLCNEWAAKEKVGLKIDFITSQGNKLLLTITSEAMAKSGHDLLSFGTWNVTAQAKNLEPVDDIVQGLIVQYGAPAAAVEYLGKQDGRWVAVPATAGSQMKGPCGRIDLFKQHAGIDLTKMYPAGGPPDKALADKWTWDAFLMAAEKCHKAGFPFGIGFGQTADSVDSAGALFAAHGAHLVDAKGNITVTSDATRQVLEYAKRLAQFLPPDVFAWDDASNNKWLISGKGTLIMNPPSAWAVAKRDNPKVAEQLWTFPAPKGPMGRYHPGLPFYWGIWKFSKNKSAARSLLTYLSQRSSSEQLVQGSGGFDMPSFAKLRDFKIWNEAGPPKGTLSHYPPSGDVIVSIPGAPAPAAIASQMFAQATMPKMIAKFVQGGESMDKVMGWAASELEGFFRT